MVRMILLFVLLCLVESANSERGAIKEAVTSPSIINGVLQIQLGMMLPYNASSLMASFGYPTSVGAIVIALERIAEERILPNVNMTFTWYFPECSEVLSAGIGTQLFFFDRIDVLIGPPCSLAAIYVAPMGKFLNIPLISWAATDSDLSDKSRFPTFARTVAASGVLVVGTRDKHAGIGSGVVELMRAYNWKRFALLYNDDNIQQVCESFTVGLKAELDKPENLDLFESVEERVEGFKASKAQIEKFVRQMIKRARIAIICLDVDVNLREFMYITHDYFEANNINFHDYVFIIPQYFPSTIRDQDLRFWYSGDYPPGTVAESDDHGAFHVLQHSLIIHVHRDNDQALLNKFKEKVPRESSKWPFFYTLKEDEQSLYGSTFSPFLHDAVYLYALALNKTLTDGDSHRDGMAIFRNAIKSTPLNGVFGTMVLNEKGDRIPILATKRHLNALVTEPLTETSLLLMYQPPGERINRTLSLSETWSNYEGVRPPPDVPTCGFEGELCPEEPDTSLMATLIVLSLATVIVIIGLILFATIKNSQRQRQRLRNLWLLDPVELVLVESGMLLRSMAPSKSNASSSGGSSSVSVGSTGSGHPGHPDTYNYHGQLVFVKTLEKVHQLTAKEENEIYAMRQLVHDNINPFMGITITAETMRFVYGHCAKGCLMSVLRDPKLSIDWMFKYSLIHDLVEGIYFLSLTPMGCHGYLSSHHCLIDSRWLLKITDYGLKDIRAQENTESEMLIWSPPEVLQDEKADRTIKTDVYSLGIIFSEVITRTPAFAENSASIEEILFRVRQRAQNIYRPTLSDEHARDVPKAIVTLMHSCWRQDPGERPGIDDVRGQIESMLEAGSSPALVDHVLRMVEKKAHELNKMTRDLKDEKKKTEALLYRLLPRQVADKMKTGERIVPEMFASVTVMFSDVVSFTTLASRCTPMQVVDLLNSLYTRFDALIEMFDIYKVETIGDGYMCVSGLPHRNGDKHAREIADLTLRLIESVGTMEIPHMPDEKIQLRIGAHSGSAVAGVVGLAMPRYCLFGDTVNTASRMESQGAPGMIQITEDTRMLLQKIGGYATEVRGEMNIKVSNYSMSLGLLEDMMRSAAQFSHTGLKGSTSVEVGKGNMVTYWLTERLKNSVTFIESDD